MNYKYTASSSRKSQYKAFRRTIQDCLSASTTISVVALNNILAAHAGFLAQEIRSYLAAGYLARTDHVPKMFSSLAGICRLIRDMDSFITQFQLVSPCGSSATDAPLPSHVDLMTVANDIDASIRLSAPGDIDVIHQALASVRNIRDITIDKGFEFFIVHGMNTRDAMSSSFVSPVPHDEL